MKRFHEELGFILHKKPYLESSLLVDVLTETQGRINLVARGGRRQQNGHGFLWQSFIPVKISFQGKTELFTATQIEKHTGAISLAGSRLLMGLYLNELLMNVLPKQDPYPEIFHSYFKALTLLEQGVHEPALRSFEKNLLNELGYGISYHQDVDHNPIHPNRYYQLKALKGFELVKIVDAQEDMDLKQLIFPGQYILNIFNEEWTNESLLAAKHIMRFLLKPLLNYQSLKTRELFL